MRYVKSKEEMAQEIIPWMVKMGYTYTAIYHLRNFPSLLFEKEEELGKLLPQFTKEDIVTFLGDSISTSTVNRFYKRSKTWMQYCIANTCYDVLFTEEDMKNTFLYTLPKKQFNDVMDLNKFMTQEDLLKLLRTFVSKSNNYMVTLVVILLWYGLSILEVANLKTEDYNMETGECHVGNQIYTIDNEYCRELLRLAIEMKSFVASNNAKWEMSISDYMLRSAGGGVKNQPVVDTTVRINHIATFNRIANSNLDTTMLQLNGKYSRMYQRELRGEDIRYSENGTTVPYVSIEEYQLYKKFLHSKEK